MAIQEAFVRLFIECGYADIKVRELVMVAGVGLGTFYEYFGSVEELARVWVHFRCKELISAAEQRLAACTGAPLAVIVDAILDSDIEVHQSAQEHWAVLYVLERQLSSKEAYGKMLERYTSFWARAFESACDWPPDLSPRTAAMVVHAIAYGLISQSFMSGNLPIDTKALREQVGMAVHNYLRQFMAEANATRE
jgi:AcrR family transcriptional regulator